MLDKVYLNHKYYSGYYVGTMSEELNSPFNDLPPKSMSTNKRRYAYAIQQNRHVSMYEWANILIVESKWDGTYEQNLGMTESKIAEYQEPSKIYE